MDESQASSLAVHREAVQELQKLNAAQKGSNSHFQSLADKIDTLSKTLKDSEANAVVSQASSVKILMSLLKAAKVRALQWAMDQLYNASGSGQFYYSNGNSSLYRDPHKEDYGRHGYGATRVGTVNDKLKAYIPLMISNLNPYVDDAYLEQQSTVTGYHEALVRQLGRLTGLSAKVEKEASTGKFYLTLID